MAVDGFVRRWPIIGQPLFFPSRSTRSPAPHQRFPKPAPIPTYERRLWGADNFDRFENQRFERGPSRLTGPKPGVKTYGGFGVVNPVYVEPETRVKTFNAPASYGNILPRAPVKSYEQGFGQAARTPIKTY
jgi:hypothetical protein